MTEKRDEKWLLSKGWTKHKGFAIMVSGEFDEKYWKEEDRADVIKEGITFYMNDKEEDEFAGELEDCIERQEEWDDSD